MRTRTSLRSISLALALACGTVATHGFAQTDTVTEVAKQRFADGVKLYGEKKFKEARDAFMQAYALKRVPAVLLNLGQSEVKAGFYEDGGNHLTQFLREHKPMPQDQKEAAEAGIADAKKKTGYVIISVDAGGADVSVDGTTVGKSPIIDPYFVKAGKHTAYATFGGKSATVQFDAKVGQAASAMITLGVAGVAPPPPPAPTPVPTQTQPPPQPYPPPAQTYQPPPAYPPYGQPYQPYGPPPPQPTATQPPPDQSQPAQREPFGDWFKKKPIAWVGVGVTGAGFLTGLIGGIALGAVTAKANNDAKTITDFATSQNLGRAPCGDPGGGGDAPGYEQACNTLRQDLKNRDAATVATAVGFVIMGVGAIGTFTYIMVDWFPGKKQQAGQGQPGMSWQFVPRVGPTDAGLGVVGKF
jgi:hypothetical protein